MNRLEIDFEQFKIILEKNDISENPDAWDYSLYHLTGYDDETSEYLEFCQDFNGLGWCIESALKNCKEILDSKKNDLIDTLIASCNEGYSGEWDCSTNEGKESFLDMIELLEQLK